jgi:hypothetical protein
LRLALTAGSSARRLGSHRASHALRGAWPGPSVGPPDAGRSTRKRGPGNPCPRCLVLAPRPGRRCPALRPDVPLSRDNAWMRQLWAHNGQVKRKFDTPSRLVGVHQRCTSALTIDVYPLNWKSSSAQTHTPEIGEPTTITARRQSRPRGVTSVSAQFRGGGLAPERRPGANLVPIPRSPDRDRKCQAHPSEARSTSTSRQQSEPGTRSAPRPGPYRSAR